MRTSLVALLLACMFALSASGDDLTDDFSSAEFKGRLAERGAWSFENNTATCSADPKLYKQFKNHGPILRWPREFTDGTIEFEIKAAKCQRVVFTLNGDGHIFRVVLIDATPQSPTGASNAQSRVLAWATKSSKQNKGDAIKPKGLPDLAAIDGEWTKVKLRVSDDRASLVIGDFQTQIEHVALRRDKNMITLSFAYWSLAVRAVRFSQDAGEATETIREMSAKVGDHKLRYLLQIPTGQEPKDGWPLLLFLHGYGECGDDIEKVKTHGPPKLISRFDELAVCVIVSPQCPRDSWWRVAALKKLVDEVVSDRRDIDQSRLYVTGLSMGGYGTWSLISHYADYFAAAIPICGGGDPFRLPKNRPPIKKGILNEFKPDCLKQASDLPLWTFHGTDDGSVPIVETERLIGLLKESGSKARFTVYEGAGHVEAWEKAYSDPDVWKWLFSQTRSPAR